MEFWKQSCWDIIIAHLLILLVVEEMLMVGVAFADSFRELHSSNTRQDAMQNRCGKIHSPVSYWK